MAHHVRRCTSLSVQSSPSATLSENSRLRPSRRASIMLWSTRISPSTKVPTTLRRLPVNIEVVIHVTRLVKRKTQGEGWEIESTPTDQVQCQGRQPTPSLAYSLEPPIPDHITVARHQLGLDAPQRDVYKTTRQVSVVRRPARCCAQRVQVGCPGQSERAPRTRRARRRRRQAGRAGRPRSEDAGNGVPVQDRGAPSCVKVRNACERWCNTGRAGVSSSPTTSTDGGPAPCPPGAAAAMASNGGSEGCPEVAARTRRPSASSVSTPLAVREMPVMMFAAASSADGPARDARGGSTALPLV